MTESKLEFPLIVVSYYECGGDVFSELMSFIVKPRTVIGRDKDKCDVFVDCRSVSRVHCTISLVDGVATMLDGDGETPSTWGIWLEGERFKSIELNDRAVVTIFDNCFEKFTIEYRARQSAIGSQCLIDRTTSTQYSNPESTCN